VKLVLIPSPRRPEGKGRKGPAPLLPHGEQMFVKKQVTKGEKKKRRIITRATLLNGGKKKKEVQPFFRRGEEDKEVRGKKKGRGEGAASTPGVIL